MCLVRAVRHLACGAPNALTLPGHWLVPAMRTPHAASLARARLRLPLRALRARICTAPREFPRGALVLVRRALIFDIEPGIGFRAGCRGHR